MFDHDDAVALLHKGVEDFQQFADILEMEAGGGLVQYVERVAGGSTAEFLCELHALGFAAGEGRCLLDRQSVVVGKRVSVRVELGVRRIIKYKKTDLRT